MKATAGVAPGGREAAMRGSQIESRIRNLKRLDARISIRDASLGVGFAPFRALAIEGRRGYLEICGSHPDVSVAQLDRMFDRVAFDILERTNVFGRRSRYRRNGRSRDRAAHITGGAAATRRAARRQSRYLGRKLGRRHLAARVHDHQIANDVLQFANISRPFVRDDGGSGTDTVSYAGAASGVTANLATNSATGDGTDVLNNFENLTGSANADTLTGDASALADQEKTTVRSPWRITRCSMWYRTARARTTFSRSRPIRSRSSGVCAWLTRSVSCSMIGPSSRSGVT
jgi:hypothetical protein